MPFFVENSTFKVNECGYWYCCATISTSYGHALCVMNNSGLVFANIGNTVNDNILYDYQITIMYAARKEISG